MMLKPKPKILTIDDEIDFTEMVQSYFSLRGYDVLAAHRGVVGLEIIENEAPDVILLDLKMPGIDGDQILQHLKKMSPDSKVIMITAFRDEGQKMEKKFLASGGFAYIEKPISSMKKLEEIIKKALEDKEKGK